MAALLDTPTTKLAYDKYRHFNQDERLRALDNAHQQYLYDYASDVGAAHRQESAEGKIETALAMKRKGFSPSDIADITGLSTAEIERLT